MTHFQVTRDWLGRRRGDFRRRIIWLPAVGAVVGALLAALLAPAVNATHPADRLQAFFGIAAGVMFAVLLAVGVIQLPSSEHPERVLQLLRPRFFVMTTFGIAVSLAGLITSLDAWTYRCLFAATIGAGIGAVLWALLVSNFNVREQRDAARAARAKRAARPQPSRTDERDAR